MRPCEQCSEPATHLVHADLTAFFDEGGYFDWKMCAVHAERWRLTGGAKITMIQVLEKVPDTEAVDW